MTQAFDIAIDVSDNNVVTDWSAVKAHGIEIVMVKAMQGTSIGYKTYKSQSEGARKEGLIVIPYLFLSPADDDVKTACTNFIIMTGLSKGMPFMIDWEGHSTCSAQVCEDVGEILAAATALRLPLGYWGMPGSTPERPTDVMAKWDRMVPRYPIAMAYSWDDIPDKCKKYPEQWWKTEFANVLPKVAQYTEHGKVPGIHGYVDRSVCFGDSLEEVLKYYRY